jgi:hypothetical protein
MEFELDFILRPKVSRPFRLGIGLPFGAHDQILSFPFFSDNCFNVLPVGRCNKESRFRKEKQFLSNILHSGR